MRRAFLLLPLLVLCGCMALYQPPWTPTPATASATGDPAVDCRAQTDLNQPITQGMQGMAIGSGVGAALGILVGGFAFGTFGTAAGWGALAGGVGGAAVGASRGQEDQDAAYQTCLSQSGAKSPDPAQK
jgi:hypothetical protein